MVSCIAIPTTENPSQCNQDWAVYLSVPQVIPLYDICEMNTVFLCPISFYELLWCIEQRITTYLSSFTKIQPQVGKMTFSIIGSIKKKIARIPPNLVGKLFKVGLSFLFCFFFFPLSPPISPHNQLRYTFYMSTLFANFLY